MERAVAWADRVVELRAGRLRQMEGPERTVQ